MLVPEPARIDTAELQHLLQALDPAVLLVPRRILRRVIKHDRHLTGVGLQVPHRKTYVIDREALLKIADRTELLIDPGRPLPKTLLLLNRPDAERLARQPRGEALLKFWRLLFHARVHAV